MDWPARFLCWPISVGFLIATGANADAGHTGMTFACLTGFIGHVLLGLFGEQL
jgi:hypothetical protein